MRSKAQPNTVKARTSDDESVWNIKFIAVLVSILIGLALLGFGFTKLKQSRVDSIPKEFEARIIDKWAGFAETEFGSEPYFRIVVEIEGNRLNVPVNKEIYDQAQVGMRLKRSDKGLQIIRDMTVIKKE